jgi:predicted TIM-barrel fold metal-dependent hydrolase
VQNSIDEACFALDVLRADGIGVQSNHHGMYMSDARLDPFYAVLNERKTVMFIHPTSPSCTGCSSVALGYPFEASAQTRDPVRAELRKLYFDLAGAPLSELLHALFQVANPDHIFYGSDWPFTPAMACIKLAEMLDAQISQNDELLDRLMIVNARKLFPRFA